MRISASICSLTVGYLALLQLLLTLGEALVVGLRADCVWYMLTYASDHVAGRLTLADEPP
jgi:hypothetical protein